MHGIALHQFAGLRVFSQPYMADWKQVKFPRSKKKRIQKKWSRRPENYRDVPWGTFYRIGDAIYAHPMMIEKWKRYHAALQKSGRVPF